MTRARRLATGALLTLLLAAVAAAARAGPPAEPAVAAMPGGVGRPGGDARDPGRRQPRHAPPGGLRLCPPDRLRRATSSWCRTSPERSTSRTGECFTIHLRAGPPLVGRRAVHHRGLPLLVGGHGQQPAAQPGRAAARSAARGRAADGRDPRRADRPLFLVEAQPVLPAGAGRGAAAVHLRAGALPRGSSTSATPSRPRSPGWSTAERARDWAQVHGRRDDMYRFDNPDLPTLQPWVMRTRPPAERFIAERNPHYHRVDRARPAAALPRPRDPGGGRRPADPGQDRRRRDRPAGARPDLQGLPVPQGRARPTTICARCSGRPRAAPISRSTPT